MGNKFGMFIHWGIYALTEYQEQYRGRKGIPREEYRKLMQQFNPSEYDPEEWVEMAYQAGMRYICFTTKHHDGFCMWETKHTDFNIMNTPYGKDVLKMLAKACEERGMLLSLYYSIPDWDHPNSYNEKSTHQFPLSGSEHPDIELYREYVKNQITELLTGYGKIYTLFWDISPRINDSSVNELVRKLQPDILINNRGYDEGDFSTPEREVPEGQRFERMTEACQSVGEQSWGYRKNEDYYTSKFIMYSIDKIMAMGGSYLLNVGPMANGRIDDRSAAIVKRIGSWYIQVREALEDTQPALDMPAPQGCIPVRMNDAIYLHFYRELPSCGVTLRPLKHIPQSVVVLNNMQPVHCEIAEMPDKWDMETLHAKEPYLHLTNLPVEELAGEPIILKIINK